MSESFPTVLQETPANGAVGGGGGNRTRETFPPGGAIYAIQAVHGGSVKIGYVHKREQIRQRLGALQCGNPFELVVRRIEAGTRASELRLHREFYDVRLVGEWFQPTKAIALRFGALEGVIEARGVIYDRGFEDGWEVGFDDAHGCDQCGGVLCDCRETPASKKRRLLGEQRIEDNRFAALHGSLRGARTRSSAA